MGRHPSQDPLLCVPFLLHHRASQLPAATLGGGWVLLGSCFADEKTEDRRYNKELAQDQPATPDGLGSLSLVALHPLNSGALTCHEISVLRSVTVLCPLMKCRTAMQTE